MVQRLATRIAAAVNGNTPSFPAVHHNIEFPGQVQLKLFGGGTESHVRMGTFYELLTAGLFGGELHDAVGLKQYQTGRDHDYTIKPDVINHANNTTGESKAVRSGHATTLLDDQIEAYEGYQKTNRHMRIYFAYYRHSFQKIKSTKLQAPELFTELGGGTLLGVMLPFSIIMTMFNSERNSRYETEKWHHCTRVNSTVINEFFFTPKEAITSHGLEPEDFVWDMFKTPEGMVVADSDIKQFPFIVIADKDHAKWIAEHFPEEESKPVEEEDLSDIPF